MEEILSSYYADNARKLHKMIDRVLFKLHFTNIDKDDFYSLGNEVFTNALADYNQKESFDGFLYSCLYKKFCTEMTKMLRDKRCMKIRVSEEDRDGSLMTRVKVIQDERLDAPIAEEGGVTLGDIIESNRTVESELFKRNEECLSENMCSYLNKLSVLQKEILRLTIEGYSPNEIMGELRLGKKQYADCMLAIKSYKNTRCIVGLVRRK